MCAGTKEKLKKYKKRNTKNFFNKNKEKFLNLKCFPQFSYYGTAQKEEKKKLECNSDETITEK